MNEQKNSICENVNWYSTTCAPRNNSDSNIKKQATKSTE